MVKRVLDFLLALTGLICLSPVIVVVAILVRVKLGSPVIFRQQRPGLRGEPFTIMKFRSMTDTRDGDGSLLPDDQRLTGFGKILRTTSLDEMPQLVSILKGEMSFIGPRPLLMEYLPLYSPEQARRHDVRPGITGWAQINGRNAISWEEKFELDLYYIDHQSLWLDIKIAILSVRCLFQRRNISARNSATMPKFTGSRKSE